VPELLLSEWKEGFSSYLAIQNAKSSRGRRPDEKRACIPEQPPWAQAFKEAERKMAQFVLTDVQCSTAKALCKLKRVPHKVLLSK
jgi:hypothetical protein